MHDLKQETAENFYTILKSCPHKWTGYPLFCYFSRYSCSKTSFPFFHTRNAVCGNVDKLSTANVDNPGNTGCFVDSVDKLSTANVDKSRNTVCFVDNVDKLSTANVDKFFQAK
ncbi:MAG TPA: hypothetical protein VGN15_03680 [Ktedonobacteraceae bacterium]|nr:hypothetical protein [Ktedonobacteraceae bacterium]